MTTKSKLFLIFGLLFLSFFVFIVGSAGFMFFVMPAISGKRAVELNRKRHAETFGTITSVSRYRSSGDKYRGSSVSTTYHFEYVVNDVSFKGEQSSGGGGSSDEEKTGLKVKVCYDPADPKSAEFYNLKVTKICGKTSAESLEAKSANTQN